MNLPLVYIFTLNWNRLEDTLACLASLEGLHYPNKHIIAIDNGSTDGSPNAISEKYPNIDQIINETNRGFAGGFNVGLRYALKHGGDFAFIVNNDTTIAPNALDILIDAAQPPEIGAVSPMIYYADEPGKIWSAGAKRNPITLDTIGDQGHQNLITKPTEQDFLSGCGLLIKTAAMEEVGLLDERFFVYYEDSDYSLRLRKAGYQLLIVPGAKMWHKISQSSEGSDSPSERYWMGKSSVIFFSKHSKGLQRVIIFIWRLGSAIKTSLRLVKQGKTKAVEAYWKGLWDGLHQ